MIKFGHKFSQIITRTSDADCVATDGTCEKEQADGNGNGCGDVCECYADCTGVSGVPDGKVSAWDYGLYNIEDGRMECPACP